MKIYKAEAKLKDQLLNNKITFASKISPVNIDPVFKRVVINKQLLERAAKATSLEIKQPDLYYFDSVLATAGLMNLNDDYFHIEETWIARHSPIDKQINHNHDEKNIIGHMTGCFAVNFDKTEILSDDLLTDELPDKYHLVTAGVLYRRWEDEDLQTRMDDIIDRITKGELFVSMECLFNDFDYIWFSEDKASAEIINRNQETAFLTEYLRGFGGSGVYKSRQVGRLLKNIVFSGKGIVETPANPNSIIFNSDEPLKITATYKEIISNGESKTMAESKVLNEAVQGVTLQAHDFNALEKQIATLTSALDAERKDKEEAKAKAEKQAKADSEKELNDLKAAVAAKDTELKSFQGKLEKSEADHKVTVEKLAEAEKKIADQDAALAKVAAEQKVQKRVALLVKNGYTDEEAVATEQKFTLVDDATFETIAEMTKKEKKDKKGANPDGCAASLDIDADANEDNADSSVLGDLELQKGIANIVKNTDGEAASLLKKMQSTMARQSELCQKHNKNK